VATECFDAVLGERPNQVEKQRPDVRVTAADLLNIKATPGDVTEAGVRTNVSVGIQYIASWLAGTGAAAINNLMEDAATAEISRAQVWQWVRHGVSAMEGTPLTRDLVRKWQAEELRKIGEQLGLETYNRYPFAAAAQLFERVALTEDFPEFLTLPAYELID